jgi:mannosylglycerate hydrolase MGH1-like protein
MKSLINAERLRLRESRERVKHWKRWGPYLSERAWGTVREDYSPNGEAWAYFPHDHARSRAYRWNEDGLAGISDRHQVLCFAIALWNEQDPILKERLFGLTGPEGNHGEDVKEYYFYFDSTPTHSYMKFLYKYPQAAFPYQQLVEENARRGKDQPEFELLDTGVFDSDRYFDVFVEYAKADFEDICIRIRLANRASETAQVRVLPTMWFRNTWSWDNSERPLIEAVSRKRAFVAESPHLGSPYALYFEGSPELLFAENDTNYTRLFGVGNSSPYVKDAFHEYIIGDKKDSVNPALRGTKAALHYSLKIAGREEATIKLRLARNEGDRKSFTPDPFGQGFEAAFADRIREADEFYDSVIPAGLDADTRNILRQAYAGLLWSKQYYHFVVRDWLAGDPAMPPPAAGRKSGRNSTWPHLYNEDIISMPDKWEYPWYAAWDLAFHSVALARVDPDFAKEQLVLMLREWYMHPSGQIPAYEWAFGDVNPPVHAWAALAVYEIEKEQNGGKGDVQFLERVFHKLMLNFTWWVNRKDAEGQNVFQGGFLGLDNIGVFDRSAVLPSGGHIEQSDGTSWMAMYCLDMFGIAFELARYEPVSHDRVYGDVASKFWEHFVYIARAMNHMGEDGLSLWNEEDGFFYDALHLPDDTHVPLRVRSLVGLIPMYAVRTLEPDLLDAMPGFKRRLEWFIQNRPDLTTNMACMKTPGMKERRLFAIPDQAQLKRILKVMLDEEEFLSPHGVRSVSRYHRSHPYVFDWGGQRHEVGYDPGEGTSRLFGGNSNWRGPVWMPVNFLLVESLRRFHQFYGDSLTVECPTGSGRFMNLSQVADDICRRLLSLFQRGETGHRPIYGEAEKFQRDPHWRDYIQFHEYFHGDSGAGVGASHQTGWSALVTALATRSSEPEPKAQAASSGGRQKREAS